MCKWKDMLVPVKMQAVCVLAWGGNATTGRDCASAVINTDCVAMAHILMGTGDQWSRTWVKTTAKYNSCLSFSASARVSSASVQIHTDHILCSQYTA